MQPVDYPTPILVGVYGTLKMGGSNHALLSDSPLISQGATLSKYRLVSMGGFPGILPGDESVAVEIYEVSEETLRYLDQLEGHPTFYVRKIIPIITVEGVREVWVYHLADPNKYSRRTPIYTHKDGNGLLNWDKVNNAKLYGRVSEEVF